MHLHPTDQSNLAGRVQHSDDHRSCNDGHGAGHDVACKKGRGEKSASSDALRRNCPAARAPTKLVRLATRRRQSAGRACFDV
jgi:hypothetical protein